MAALAAALLLALPAHGAAPPSCAQTASPPGSAKPNRHPLWALPPRPVTTVPNGARLEARLEAGDPALAPPITVVHVSGSAFEMGEAHGRLMKRDLLEYLPLVIEYLNVSLADVRRHLPPLCCCPLHCRLPPLLGRRQGWRASLALACHS